MTDLFRPEGPDEQTGRRDRPIAQRLAWFVGIALASVAVVAAAAYILRGLLFL